MKPSMMDDGAKRWMLKIVKKNFWRVSASYELDDLIQDGFLTFYRIAERYKHVKDKAHLMRLFQVAFTNHIHHLANDKTKYASEVRIADLLRPGNDENELWERISGSDDDLVILIADAPPRIYALLTALERVDPKRLRAPYRRRANGSRETYNERLCRIAGIDANTNLVTELREYLRSA